MIYILLQFNKHKKQALSDTGIKQRALSGTELRCILVTSPAALKQELDVPVFDVQIMNGSIVLFKKLAV